MKQKKIDGKYLHQWILDQIETRHPSGDFSIPDENTALYTIVPRGYMQSLDELQRQDWNASFRNAMSRGGYRALGGPGGTQAAPIKQMAFPEFFEVCVGRAVLAKGDLEAIQVDAVAWAAQNDPALDIDAFMADIKAAAGL